MVSLQNKILYLLLLIPSFLLGQTYNYTYTDPCTLNQQSVVVPLGQEVVLNYFGEVQTFTQEDFSNGVFDNWLTLVSQLNSSAPCQSVTEILVNETNGTTVANTLTVVTNIMSVMGGGMLPPVESINNSSGGNNSENEESENEEEGEQNSQTNGSNSNQSGGTGNTQTNQSNQEANSNQSNAGGNTESNTESTGGTEQSNNTTTGGEQTSESPVNQNQESSTQNNSTTEPNSTGENNSQVETPSETTSQQSEGTQTQSTANSVSNVLEGGNNQNQQSTESTSEQAEGKSAQSTANSLSNALDGGSGGGGKKDSNKAQKQAGSLIASGDVVVISNLDQNGNNQVRFVGSMTHANTKNTRIKGALFTYTTGSNDASLTFYKSWINPKKTFNLVMANTTASDFKNNLLNTTTALESFRFLKKQYTGMIGVNFTVGKLGDRTLKNLSTVGGIHTNFKVSPRVTTSVLMLGVYSPFTQFYEGRWWDAGLLIVPFNSWDIKITKTFKYNISITGVYQLQENFLNYQILTGGKLNF